MCAACEGTRTAISSVAAKGTGAVPAQAGIAVAWKTRMALMVAASTPHCAERASTRHAHFPILQRGHGRVAQRASTARPSGRGRFSRCILLLWPSISPNTNFILSLADDSITRHRVSARKIPSFHPLVPVHVAVVSTARTNGASPLSFPGRCGTASPSVARASGLEGSSRLRPLLGSIHVGMLTCL